MLAAKLRRADIDGAAGAREEVERIVARIRARWPRTRIVLRADSGFAREDLMAWCEANRVDYLLGLAKNARLLAQITEELAAAKAAFEASAEPARRSKTSPTARWTAGADRGVSWARPSIWRRAPTRASS